MSFVLLSTIVLTTLTHSTNPDPSKWDYNEEGLNISHWIEEWPECGGDYQSPIDVPISSEECTEPLLLDFTTTDKDQQFAIRNNGHSLQAIPFDIIHSGGSEIAGLEILHHTNDTNIRLKNPFYNTYESDINQEYCFDSLHFHWGETDEYGSEHFLGGRQYPLELHMVLYSCDYHRLSDATSSYSSGELLTEEDDDNILSVIGILFEISEEPNPTIDKILTEQVLEGVSTFNNEGYTNLLSLYYTQFNLTKLLPENKEYISYKGSLTTPPCFETVRWFIMNNTLSVSVEQMRKFRSILESTDLDDDMAPNWRPQQKLGDRTIYKCKNEIEENYNKISSDKHGSDDDTIHLEIDADHEKWLWVAIGVLLLVTGYLCYLVNCTSKDDAHAHKKNSSYTNEQGNDDESSAIFDESI